jgi:hypothetical protein
MAQLMTRNRGRRDDATRERRGIFGPASNAPLTSPASLEGSRTHTQGHAAGHGRDGCLRAGHGAFRRGVELHPTDR